MPYLRLHSGRKARYAGLWGWCMCSVLLSLLGSQGTLLAQPPPAGDSPEIDLVDVIQVAPQQVRADRPGQLLIDLHFPDGYHLNPRAPLQYSIDVRGQGIHIAETDRGRHVHAPLLPLVIPFQASAGTHQTTATVDMTFYYCRGDDTGVCVMQSVRWQVPLQTRPEHATSQAGISYKAELPVLQKQL